MMQRASNIKIPIPAAEAPVIKETEIVFNLLDCPNYHCSTGIELAWSLNFELVDQQQVVSISNLMI